MKIALERLTLESLEVARQQVRMAGYEAAEPEHRGKVWFCLTNVPDIETMYELLRVEDGVL